MVKVGRVEQRPASTEYSDLSGLSWVTLTVIKTRNVDYAEVADYTDISRF